MSDEKLTKAAHEELGRVHELGMFGCTEAESRAGIDQLVEGNFGNVNMSLASILSDCQELIEHGEHGIEQARQYMNRVKHALFEAAPIELWKREG